MEDHEDVVMDDDYSSSDESSNDSDVSYIERAFSEPTSDSSIILCEDAIFHDHVKALVESNDARDKEALNQICINFAKADNLSGLLVLRDCGYEHKLDVINDQGQTLMHLAFYADHTEIVDYFVDYLKYTENDHINDINYTDCNGLSHLHIVCTAYSKNNLAIATKYLKNGADVNAVVHTDPKNNLSGFTPLHFACSDYFNSENLVGLLLKYRTNIDAVDDLGRTALHLLCSMFTIPRDFEKNNPIRKKMELLLKNGINVNAKDKQGNTALHYIFPDDYKFVNVGPYFNTNIMPIKETWYKFKLLLKYGADVTASNNNDDTILHRIIKSLKYTRLQVEFTNDENIRVRMVKKILGSNKKVDLSAVDSDGKTPLQLAFSMMDVDIIRLLLNHNADISSLTLINNGDYCFYKSVFLPNLKAVESVMDLLQLLSEKEFPLNLRDNIAFLRFLVHDVNYSTWVEVLDTKKYRSSEEVKSFLENLLEYGSSPHIKSIYNQMIITILANEQTQLKNKVTQHGQEILSRKKVADFYVDQEIYNMINITDEDVISHTEEAKIAQEIALMKNTFVTDNVTLHDLIVKHPFDIYPFIRDANLEELTRGLVYYKTSVNGHFAKSLARNYIKKISSEYLRILLTPLLPNPCCENISYYLENDDILNVCISVVSVMNDSK